VAEDTECIVETYKKFVDENAWNSPSSNPTKMCKFDREKGELVVEEAFVAKSSYSGKISVTLTKVRNPEDNKNIKKF